ncbi:MAG: hypothetical protein COB04_11915 [Gammaproteobacteria bacterium]|nr:MAG: hypothetical protein COB04_11915 [Gammaproteobacteria bacterium]
MADLNEMVKDKLAGVKGGSPSAGGTKGLSSLFGALGGSVVAVMAAVAIWASIEPAIGPVPTEHKVVGYATTQTVINVASTLLNKPEGFTSNDMLPPFIFLDNMPSFEFGALVQLRDLTRAMRKDIARSQSQSTEDKDLSKAEPFFNLSHTDFLLPSSEGEYRHGIVALERFKKRLLDSDTRNVQFYARADNLRNWLQDVETRLGSLSQRLSASVVHSRVNTDLAGDAAAQQSTPNFEEVSVQTVWHLRDDVFYEARGATWALIQFLRAIEVDFRDVLEKKNALASVQQIIRELESCQDTVWSPIILNGDGFGLMANHSLIMANYISRANAAMIDLRQLLLQG